MENYTVPPQLCRFVHRTPKLCRFVYRTIFLATKKGPPKPEGFAVSMAFMSALNPPRMAVDFSAGDEATIFPMRPASPEANNTYIATRLDGHEKHVRSRNKQNITDINRCYSPGLNREDVLRTEFSSLFDKTRRK
jgi:hypothetical protein